MPCLSLEYPSFNFKTISWININNCLKKRIWPKDCQNLVVLYIDEKFNIAVSIRR
jgi:hypothetical protein